MIPTDFYNFTGTEFSAAIVLFNLFFSFLLQLVVVWVYKKTHRGLSHSQSFLFTLVIIGVLGTVVLMVVRNNLVGAFALLGAFSLIRFRTIVKETRDVAFVFFALAMGVAVGTNNYSIALLATVSVSAMILLLSKYGFGLINREGSLGFVLTMETTKEFSADVLQNKISSHAIVELLHAKYKENSGGHYAFSVHFKDAQSINRLSNELKNLSGIHHFEFITSKHSVEY